MNLTWSALLSATLMAAAPLTALAETKTPEQRELEDRVRAVNDTRGPVTSPVSYKNWRDVAGKLAPISAVPDLAASCTAPSHVTFGGKYAVSVDSQTGTPCKLYDLSFPTLKAFGKVLVFSALPTQKYTAKDYINWIKGNNTAVETKIKAFENGSNFAPMAAGVDTAEWVDEIQFRESSTLSFTAMAPKLGSRRLPKSFRASDLEIGRRFVFSAQDRQRLKALIAVLRHTGTPEATVKLWSQTAERPMSFLEKIQFNWNDTKKVYEIALDAEFLPLGGPVALVDFKVPYKPAVERMIRSVLSAALQGLSRLIPHPTVQNVVDVAIQDAFEFVEMAYVYQYNQLEDTLRGSLDGRVKSTLKSTELQSILDLAFGTRSDFMTQYLMTIVQGQKFDWAAIEKIGKRARYGIEKAREITMNEMNSRLVLKTGCEMQIVNSYYGVCSKKGKKVALHSLMSQNSVLFWNFGAPMIHRYDSPAEVPLKRGASYLLSVGARIMNLGISSLITNSLADALKSFAFAGMMDEGILRNRLWTQKLAGGQLDADSQKLLQMLYIQNVNPFLAHSEGMEAKFIQINAQALQIQTVSAAAGLEN